MSPSLRFLAIAVLGWAGIRAATLDALPGREFLGIPKSEARVPPVLATSFAPIGPVEDFPAFDPAPPSYPAQYPATAGRAYPVPVYYAAPTSSSQSEPRPMMPRPTAAFAMAPSPDAEWPIARPVSATFLPARPVSRPTVQSVQAPPAAKPFDRVQLTSWAMLRGRQGQPLGTPSLAAGGTLGGSQAGARITYNVNRQLAASLRTTSDVGRRGAEAALGVRVQPLGGVPVWLTAERRQRLSRTGSGRNAFAIFAEAGVYGRPMPWQFQLDAYLQGGVVGARSRDLFVDGGATVTRPIFGRFYGGLGMWGAAQPGAYRFDAGPRVTMQVRPGLRVHADWRHQLAGNAQPGSGPALTLAGDF